MEMSQCAFEKVVVCFIIIELIDWNLITSILVILMWLGSFDVFDKEYVLDIPASVLQIPIVLVCPSILKLGIMYFRFRHEVWWALADSGGVWEITEDPDCDCGLHSSIVSLSCPQYSLHICISSSPLYNTPQPDTEPGKQIRTPWKQLLSYFLY